MTAVVRSRLKGVLASLAARAARRPRLTLAQIAAGRPRRVLVVRQHNQMGDMVCATPALRALRRFFPEAEFFLVTAPVNHEVVAHNPHVDRVLLFDRAVWRDPARLWRFVRELRGLRPDLAIVLNSVSFSVTSSWIAAASGAPAIVGGDSRPYGWDVSRHLFSLEMPSRPDLDRHAVLHNLAPLEAVGIPADGHQTVVVPTAEEEAAAADLVAALPPGAGLAVVHPGAGKLANRWPPERFAAVAARAADAGERVVVLQGPADGGTLAAFAAALATLADAGARSRVVVAPRLTAGACAALLRRADRFLCNDTGVMHVAGAVGAPTVALFGPTDPALWKPLSPAVRAVRAENGRLDALGVETVWSALQELPRPQAGVS